MSITIDMTSRRGIINSCFNKDFPRLVRLLKNISEEHRLKIICLLKNGERCVCELIDALKLPHNLVSHHLKVLKKLGLVSYRRQGKFRLYKLKQRELKSFLAELAELTGGGCR